MTRLVSLGLVLLTLGTAGAQARSAELTTKPTVPRLSLAAAEATWTAFWEPLTRGDVHGAEAYLHSAYRPHHNWSAPAMQKLLEVAAQLPSCRLVTFYVSQEEAVGQVVCQTGREWWGGYAKFQRDTDEAWRLTEVSLQPGRAESPPSPPPAAEVEAAWQAFWNYLAAGDLRAAEGYLHTSRRAILNPPRADPEGPKADLGKVRELANMMKFCRPDPAPLMLLEQEAFYRLECSHGDERLEWMLGARRDFDGVWRLVPF
jgi:hypothetical protein